MKTDHSRKLWREADVSRTIDPFMVVKKIEQNYPLPQFVELSEDPKIPAYMKMAAKLGWASSPQEVLTAFVNAMAEVHGSRGRIVVSTAGLGPGEYRVSPLIRIADAARQRERVRSLTASDDVIQNAWYFGVNEGEVPVHSGGLIGQVIESLEPKLVHHLNPAADPLLAEVAPGFRSMLAVPMFFTQSPDYWFCMFDEAPEGLSASEVAETILRGNLMGKTIKNLNTSQRLRRATAFISRQVDEIAAIQRDFLPSDEPVIPGLNVATSYETFERAGGDYYDFLPMREKNGEPDLDGPWAILLADAAGHGPAAAVVTAMLHTVLDEVPGSDFGPAAILEHANRRLIGRRQRLRMVTAFCGVYDPATRELTYASAGHPPPLRKRDGAGITELNGDSGYPLGVMPEVDAPEHAIVLERGETVLLFTDGVTDAEAPTGERLGLEGVGRALMLCEGDPSCAVETLRSVIKDFEGGAQPSDDQTLVALQVK